MAVWVRIFDERCKCASDARKTRPQPTRYDGPGPPTIHFKNARAALYVLVKERKVGVGCVDAWKRDQATLIERARHLLAPSLKTLGANPFLFGEAPTLADAAHYGQCKMLEEGDPRLLPRVAEALVPFSRRLEERAAAANQTSF